jgi:sugar phosphate isomerase/epimerase
MNLVKQTLDKIGYKGWLVVERSRDASDPKNVKRNFGANVAYMKSIFQ